MTFSSFHNNRKFLLRFVTSYSILLVIILVMGLILYQIGITDAKNGLYRQNLTVLEKSVSHMDDSLILMSSLSSQLASNKTLRNIVAKDIQEEDFYTTARTSMKILTEQLSFQATLPLDDFYIYLSKTNYMLYNNALSNGNLYYHFSKAYTSELYDHWLAMMNSYDNTRMLIPLSYYKNNAEASLLYRIPFADYSLFKKYEGFVCFEINQDKLSDYFSGISLYENGFLFVTDSNGNTQFIVTDYKTRNVEESAFLSSLPATFSTEGFTKLTYNKEKMLVTKVSSDYNQWVYYLVQPAGLAFDPLIATQKIYSMIIIISCIFCLLIIFYLTKKNMKPIILMKSELQSSLALQDVLQQELEKQKPIIYNSYISKLMKGNITTKGSLDEIISYLKIQPENKKFAVLYASIYLDQLELYAEESLRNHEGDIEMASYKEMICNYFYEFFGVTIYIFEPEINSFTLLLSSPSDQGFDEFIEDVGDSFHNLHEQLLEEHSIWIYGGLGNRNTDLSFTWKSYQQAVEAASYVREGHVFQVYSNLKRDSSAYYYPYEMAQQLTNFIISGNSKQVQEIFKLIRRENYENRSLPISLVKWLLSDIRNTLLKIRFTIPEEDRNQAVLSELDASFQNHKTIELVEEIATKLCSLAEPKPEGNKLIASIQQYINDSYQDPSLSLKKISDEFSISESYFSYLFKAEIKQNFSEYLEQLRMEKAMFLLKTTEIGISDLFFEVGYNNANSFRRAFKKVHGAAPKTIRESLRY